MRNNKTPPFPIQPPIRIDLPKVRGKLSYQASLAEITWFQVGGAAEIMFRPQDTADLQEFLRQKSPALPVTVIGVGSNLLVRDGGIDGVVIRLGREFNKIQKKSATQLYVGAAVLDTHIARTAQQEGIGGMEFLCGIPGTLGGGIRMNAGCYGKEFKDIVESIDVVGMNGQLKQIRLKDIGFSYRHSDLDIEDIVIGATLNGTADDPAFIAARMLNIQQQRQSTQPIRSKTGGSTFANPDPALSGGKKAWQLIDEAGCRGLQLGDAMVSEMHCNFLINKGQATAADIEALGETVRLRVLEHCGVHLKWEIDRVGKPLPTFQQR